MPDLHQQYEFLHNKQLANASRKIKRVYERSISEVTVSLNSVTYKGKPFNIKDYPALNKKVESVAKKMHADIYAINVNGIKESWNLSNKKNDTLVDKRVAGKRLKKGVRQVMYDPNHEVRDNFIRRTKKGMNLSDRVWKTVDPFKKEMEQSLGLSIASGKSAATAAREVKQHLNDPDKLFRRVRGEDGKLHLSKAARDYHPGQGRYRSSYKNALRLTRTENNMAYRTADHERWNNLAFVTGIEVKLSKSHPKFDICDQLKGSYPKDFKFTGWHPQCLCYQVPKMMNDEEFEQLEDQILNGEPVGVDSKETVKQPPAEFGKWIKDNKERMDGWKSKPYWVQDNPNHLAVQKIPAGKPAGNSIKDQLTDIQKKIRPKVNKALSSIDEVHGDGILENIPFEESNRSYEAAFYSTTDGKPAKIALSKKAISPSLSIVHEMGHYFDLHAIGKKGVFASEQFDGPLQKVIVAAMKTKAVKSLKKSLKNNEVVIGGKKKPIGADYRQHIDYLLEPKEIWARAYAQYIALKTTDRALKNELKKTLVKGQSHGLKRQWLRRDFSTIEKEIDKLMKELGWISQ